MEALVSGALERYVEETSNPFDILDNRETSSRLADILAGKEHRVGQGNLFASEDRVLEELRVFRWMQGKRIPLNRRFQKEVKGKLRNITVPGPRLRSFLEDYLKGFITRFEIHNSAHGAEIGWSPERSLRTHLPFRGVLSFDLSSAFENIPESYIFGFYYKALDIYGLTESQQIHIAGFLTKLSTVPYPEKQKRGLAVGSPHTMALFNRVLLPLDEHLSTLGSQRGMHYTRWVDDLTISGGSQDVQDYYGSLDYVRRLFLVADHKVFWQLNSETPPKGAINPENAVYLLGQMIQGNIMKANSSEKRSTYKAKPLDLSDVKDYQRWD